MRKQIAAANWKMNLTYPQAENLLADVLLADIELGANQQTIFAVPAPYLIMANAMLETRNNYFIAAQNCYQKKSGAYTGEISTEMP
jgi:triosephosphate isomerase